LIGLLQVLVTKAGEIDSTHFLDPKRNQVVTVDHIKQVCVLPEYSCVAMLHCLRFDARPHQFHTLFALLFTMFPHFVYHLAGVSFSFFDDRVGVSLR
jgi:hypothetical protein